MNALLNAVPIPAALLVVGDIDQLPSVGPGQLLGRIHPVRLSVGDTFNRGVSHVVRSQPQLSSRISYGGLGAYELVDAFSFVFS